jgi:hypothetical protein
MDSSSDSSFRENESDWVTEVIYLHSGDRWVKPPATAIVLTCAGVSVLPTRTDAVRAIVVATIGAQTAVLCCLFPSKPTQPMKLVWAVDQPLILTNTGNLGVTLSLMTKQPGGS